MIAKAGIVTLGLFAGLTSVVLTTQKDFSFLGPILAIGGFIALGFIVSGIIFGFTLGSIFAFVMVAFAGPQFYMKHQICFITTTQISTLPHL